MSDISKNPIDRQKEIAENQQGNPQNYTAKIKNRTVKQIVSDEKPSNTDPDGSYTGIPEVPFGIPQQDVDDL